MASAPGTTAHKLAAAAAPPAGGEKPSPCEECEQRPATMFCSECKGVFCAECDAAVHVRQRKGHQRVPIDARPMLCSVHKTAVVAYCVHEKRLVCALCLARVVGTCDAHAVAGAIETIDKAAGSRRKECKIAAKTVAVLNAALVHETTRLQALRGSIDVRMGHLETITRHAAAAEHGFAQRLSLSNACLLVAQDVEPLPGWLREFQTIDALLGKGEETLLELCSGEGLVHALSHEFKIPRLHALARPRALPLCPAFSNSPARICNVGDGSLIIADHNGGPAWQVWRDGSQPPLWLPAATAKASVVLPLEDGYLIVSWKENKVERTGRRIAWTRELARPWSAAVVGDTVLVTMCTASRVVRLDLQTGQLLGEVAVAKPTGIALLRKPAGNVVFVLSRAHPGTVTVLHADTMDIQRTFALSESDVHDLCIACDESLYIAVRDRHVVLVVDAATGEQLASIDVPGAANGVAVSHGTIVVSHTDPIGISVIGSREE